MTDTESVIQLISFKNPVFQSYVFWTSILTLKMLFMSILVGFYRFKNKAIINPHDLHLFRIYKSMVNTKYDSLAKDKIKLRSDETNIERCKSAHLNDLENILPFFIIGFLYLIINPEPPLAINLYRAVGISRVLHTIYAMFPVLQPTRAITFFICFGATVYMAIKIIKFNM